MKFLLARLENLQRVVGKRLTLASTFWKRSLLRPLALPFNPWFVLWIIGIAGAWLLPTHLEPWRAFHADLAMTMVFVPAAFWILLTNARVLTCHAFAIFALFVACVPLVQLKFGIIYFTGDAWIAACYLFAFALTLLVGARFHELAPGKLPDALFASIGIASVLSTGLILYQWLNLSGLGMLALNMPRDLGLRPFANMGQPNHIATLLVWGLLAIWWAYLTLRIRGWIAVSAVIFLMGGIVATQSRTAWLEIALVGIGAVLYRGTLGSQRYARVLVILAMIFTTLVLSWEPINKALYFEPPRSFADEMSPGLRPAAWALFLSTVILRPWTGWGWNQLSVAQSAVALDHPSLRYTFQSSHNLVLDLFVQNGIVLGILMTLALVFWLIHKARRVNSVEACLLLMAVGVLLVHSMLEFPQNYAYFLLPAGLMMGALDGMYPMHRALHFSRWVGVALLCAGAGLMAWIAIEYNMAERSLERVRFERNRVGPSRNSKAPELLILTQLREFLWYLRLNPDAKISPEQFEAMRAVVERYPSDGNQLVFAVAAAYNGHPEVAREALARMCRMVPRPRCEGALDTWREMASSTPVLSAIVVPEMRHTGSPSPPTIEQSPGK